MTLFCSRGDAQTGSAGASRYTIRWLRRMIGIVHHAIVAAKLRRLQRELTFHERWSARPETDAANFPRRPLILGEKWDF